MKHRITVVIAYVEPSLHRWLHRVLSRQSDLQIVGPARSDTELIAILQKQKPHILLLDTRFMRRDGYSVVSHLRRCFPWTKTILLDKHYRYKQEVKAAQAGASGYIGGRVEPATLRKAMRLTEAGEIWMRRKTLSLVLDEFSRMAS